MEDLRRHDSDLKGQARVYRRSMRQSSQSSIDPPLDDEGNQEKSGPFGLEFFTKSIAMALGACETIGLDGALCRGFWYLDCDN